MILILGGTGESRELASALDREKITYYLSTATKYGSLLAKEEVAQEEQVLSGRMDKEMFKNLIGEKEISLIVDVSHPFAEIVSKTAMETSEELGITYYRYERKDTIRHEGVYYVADVKEAVELAKTFGERAFLTTGSKTLQDFVENWGSEHYTIRVLPTSDVIRKCEELGFLAKQIIAMQGPFSYGMNREQYLSYPCQSVITKDSGKAGGVDDKILAARDLGLACIVIRRPKMEYRNVFRDIEELIKRLKEEQREA